MKHFLSILFIVFFVSLISIPVAAMNTGFQLEDIPESEAIEFLEKTDIQFLETAPEKGNIISFNVIDGCIALATENRAGYNRKYLSFYNMEGLFLKGFSFNTREFGMDFDEDKIFVYFDNEDIAVCLSATGQVEEVYSIPYAENRDYWTEHVYARVRKVNGIEYRLQTGNGDFSDFLAPNYAQLVVEDAVGNERILYDNRTQRNMDNMLIVAYLFILFSIAAPTFIYAFLVYGEYGKKRKEKSDNA